MVPISLQNPLRENTERGKSPLFYSSWNSSRERTSPVAN
jgi:hypothetical protein